MDIVALLEELVNGLMAAEDSFFQHPDDFYSLETAVKSSTESFATGFLSIVLTSLNRQIRDNAWRKLRYDIQRTTSRTLISSVGDVTFECTCYKNRKDGNYTHLLEEFVRIGRNERFTEAAEAAILEEALKTSYSEAAKVIPSRKRKNAVYWLLMQMKIMWQNNMADGPEITKVLLAAWLMSTNIRRTRRVSADEGSL